MPITVAEVTFTVAETSATGIEFACARLGISCEVVESDFQYLASF